MLENREELIRRARAYRELPPPAMRRAIREAAGFSQVALGKELGVTHAAVSRWETGDRQPRGALLVDYAETLQLLNGEL
jgi:transcriptional regulator with XRE-family HTH domain